MASMYRTIGRYFDSKRTLSKGEKYILSPDWWKQPTDRRLIESPSFGSTIDAALPEQNFCYFNSFFFRNLFSI